MIDGFACLRFVGSGGYADVYEYRELGLERSVAVKVLRTAGVDASALGMFDREAKAMARLGEHPNIVPVLRQVTTHDGRSCIIMPYYTGGTLADLVRRRRLSVGEVLDIGVLLAGAVAAAHRGKVAHRDIKPANVLIDAQNANYRLADFGIAGWLRPGAVPEASGLSLPWSAPEVVEGAIGDVRSDVYSLGATLWHLLAGHAPFALGVSGDSRAALEERIRSGLLPATPRDDVPAAFVRLLRQMMAVYPAERPYSAQEVRGRLDAIRGGARSVPLGAFTPDDVDETVRRADGSAAVGDDAGETSLRPGPGAPSPAGHPGPQAFQQSLYSAPGEATGVAWTRLRPGAHGQGSPAPAPDAERAAPPGDGAAPADGSGRARPAWLWPAVAAGAVVAAALVVGSLTAGRGSSAGAAATASPSSDTQPGQDAGRPGEDVPPGDVAVTAQRIDSADVQFTWSYSGALANDTFVWQTTDGTRSGVAQGARLSLRVPAGTHTCVQIKVVRADGSDGSGIWSPPGCAP